MRLDTTLIFAIVIYTSCNVNIEEEHHEPVYIDLSHHRQAVDIKLDSFLVELNFIKLDSAAPFIASVSKVIAYDNSIYLLDDLVNQVLWFNTDGDYKGRIGERGLGPGEYRVISDIDIDTVQGEILILCDEKRSILKYTSEGDYVGQIGLNGFAYKFCILNAGHLAVFVGYDDDNYSNLKIVNFEGDIVFEAFEYPKDVSPMVFDFTGGLSKNKYGTLYADASANNIYQILPNGDNFIKYEILLGKTAWPKEKRYDFEHFFNAVKKFEVSFLGDNFYEIGDLLIFDYIQGNKEKYAYFNNKTKKLVITDNFQDDLMKKLLRPPVGITDKSQIISYIDLQAYLNNYLDNRNMKFKIKYPELDSLLNYIKEDSNPILVLYKTSINK